MESSMVSNFDPATTSERLPQPEFRQEYRLGLVVYGGVSLAIYMNGVCREFYNAVRGRGIYKLVKALTDSDIIVDVVSGTSAGGINGVLLSYALTNSDQGKAVDFKNFAEIWRESGDISKLMRQPDIKRDTNSVLDGEHYYEDRLAEAFQTASNKCDYEPQKQANEWYSDSRELDLFVTGTDTLGRVSKAFDNTGSVIEVKDHRSVFLLKYRRDRKNPFQDNRSNQRSLAKLCRITSCFPVAFPVVTVKLPTAPTDRTTDRNNQATEAVHEIDRRLVVWGQLSNRELPAKQPDGGYRLHFVDGGVLDNRPFSYTIRAISTRVAYRPVERRLFYIDPSPDQFLGSPKFNKMAKPNIWATVSDSLVGMPRYESISSDLQDIKDRNERILRYKFLRGTAERTGETKLEAARRGQPPSDDAIRRQQIYLRCRLVGMRDRILPLVLCIDQASSNSTNSMLSADQDKQVLLERAAQLITKYITDQKQQEDRENFLHSLGQEIRNLDVDYALRKHTFLLEKICQVMSDPQYDSQGQDFHRTLKRLAEHIGYQVKLLEVIQFALESMLQSEPVSRTFYALIAQASKGGMPNVDTENLTEKSLDASPPPALTSNAAISEAIARNVQEDMRQYMYDYLLKLHRWMLDADGLVALESSDLSPQPAAREFDKQDQPVPISRDFFQQLPLPLNSSQISGVLMQLQKKMNLLNYDKLGLTPSATGKDRLDVMQPESLWQDPKYQFVAGSENDSKQYFSLLRKVEQATEALIQASDTELELKSKLLNSFQSFRYVDEEVYSYEYLSDIRAKGQIEVIRISPDVAQFGFGKGKGLAEKLAGDQLNAFGGFFKKSWRSNDILWGRLDGLNRIVEALLTPDMLKNFPNFVSRQLPNVAGASIEEKTQTYLEALVTEALPDATEAERVTILEVLTRLARPDQAPSQTLEGKSLTQFLDTLVTVGQRAILKTDLKNVMEDAIAEQIDWSQQLIPSSKSFQTTVSRLGYTSTFPKTASTSNSQQVALQQVDRLVATLLSSNRKQAQKFLQQQPPDWHGQAFSQLRQTDPENWSRLTGYLTQLATEIPSLDQLYDFLKRLIIAGQAELNRPDLDSNVRADINQLNQQLKPMLQKLKPKYEPVQGYFDRAITPFAVKELAETPVKALLDDPRQIDDYFRNTYQVGSETLSTDIPVVVLEDLAARAGLVIRDILNSPPTGDTVRKTTTFRIVNRLLQAFYIWVQSKNPKTSWLPTTLKAIPALILPLLAIGGILFLVSRLPVILLIVIVTLAILQIINSVTTQIKVKSWVVWLLIAIGVFLFIAGPHLLPAGSIDWTIPFSQLRISIQNPGVN